MIYKNMLHIAMIIAITLPSMIHSMYRALILSKRTNFTISPVKRRSFYTSMPELHTMIATPKFKLSDTEKIINTIKMKNILQAESVRIEDIWQIEPVNIENVLQKESEIMENILQAESAINGCANNGLIEYIVFKATEHKSQEKKYAKVLTQLREHGYSKSACCGTTTLHSAVISDLPKTTAELLMHDNNWIHDTDLNKCIPLHYAQSPRIAKMLLDYGSKIETRDRDGNTPLHMIPHNIVPILLTAGANKHAENNLRLRIPGYGWQGITPLRKAIDEGNLKKCAALLDNAFIIAGAPNEEEKEILLALADLRFWRTKNPVYLKIKRMILGHCAYHFEEKH